MKKQGTFLSFPFHLQHPPTSPKTSTHFTYNIHPLHLKHPPTSPTTSTYFTYNIHSLHLLPSPTTPSTFPINTTLCHNILHHSLGLHHSYTHPPFTITHLYPSTTTIHHNNHQIILVPHKSKEEGKEGEPWTCLPFKAWIVGRFRCILLYVFDI